MTAHSKQAAKMFSLLLVFFTVVILVFFYTAQKNIPSSKRQEVKQAAPAVLAPIAWEKLGELTDNDKVRVMVGGTSVLAEVARSEGKKALGLSHRDPLKEGEGMLFIFDESSTLSFWNKDMRFPIDVLWLENGVVAGASESLPLFTEGGAPVIITSPSPARAALEVSEGFVKKYGITSNNPIVIYENK